MVVRATISLNANDFFSNAQGIPRPDHLRDQYGFALGGPIKKDKKHSSLWILKRYDRTIQRRSTPSYPPQPNGMATSAIRLCFAPIRHRDAQWGQPVQQQVFNPFSRYANGNRQNFTVPNVIDSNLIDPIGQKIINLYPLPTIDNAAPGTPNFHKVILSKSDGYQFDIKIDHHFTERTIFPRATATCTAPLLYQRFLEMAILATVSPVRQREQCALEDNWSPTPSMVWTNRFAIDRVVAPVTENYPNLNTAFDAPGDAILASTNGLSRFPVIQMDNNATSLFNQCCTDTSFAHTLYSYSSALSWVKGRHVLKFGGEQRLFFNNFFQPNPPTGLFHFTQGELSSPSAMEIRSREIPSPACFLVMEIPAAAALQSSNPLPINRRKRRSLSRTIGRSIRS